MKTLPLFIIPSLTISLLIPWSARADVLELRSGKLLTGKYVGGTAGTVRFETDAGVQVIETSQALALSFSSSGGGGSTGGGTAKATPAPAPAPTQVTVPAGTTLLVRMVDPVSSKDPQGKRFTTTLESDLAVNGTVVAKAGTKVYGRIQSAQQARRYTGQSKLDLRLTEVAAGPNLVPISTSGFASAGSRSVGKAARGAAAGAAIGGIADGGDGAAKGAAIGAVASGIKKGETVSVSPGTLLEFQLQQPVSLMVSK
jgi:hypothetical protein